MGIPRFLSRLKDANAVTVKCLGHADSEKHTRAIIDGPSFAHYIHSILETSPEASNKGLGTISSYEQCVSEAIRWLQMIECHGFVM